MMTTMQPTEMNGSNSGLNTIRPGFVKPVFVFFVTVGLWLAVLIFATKQDFKVPYWGLEFEANAGQEGVIVASVHPGSPADQAGVVRGARIVQLLRVSDGEVFPLSWYSLAYYRGQVRTFDDWRKVQSQKRALWDFVREDVTLIATDGRQYDLPSDRPTRWRDLPFGYWNNVVLSFLMLCIAVGLISFAPASTTVNVVTYGAICHSVHLLVHAVKAPLVLTFPPEFWTTLYFVGNLAGLLHTFAILGILWHLPAAPSRFPFVIATAVLAIITFANAHFEGFPLPLHPYLLPYFLALLFGLGLMAFQWVKWRNDPVERARMLWVHLSIGATAIPWVLLFVVPGLLGASPLVGPETGGLIMIACYVGFVFGTIRFKLFAIQSVWVGVMLWLVIITTFLFADMLFLLLLGFENLQAASLAAVVASWAIFPVKSLILDHVVRRSRIEWGGVTLKFIDEIGQLDDAGEIDGYLVRFMKSLFNVDDIALHPDMPLSDVQIEDNGLTLRFPAIVRKGSVTLHGRDRGRRLFTSHDQKVVNLLYEMALRVFEQRENQEAQRKTDKSRIARDLHDHLGGKLLSLIYTLPKSKSAQSAASETLEALKESILTLENDREFDLRSSWDEIWDEQQTRLDGQGFKIEHHAVGQFSRIVTSRVYVNIKRIAEEMVTNVLKYGDPEIPVICESEISDDGTFRVRLSNGTREGTEWDSSGGRGHPNILARASEIGAFATFGRAEERGLCYVVSLEVPLEA
ncbi:hypothetical protein [Marimonas lutisalis]|uniref:hypothetical protein n=1 Tax=Marimonas lutisalis TaxID=2545756 RepID=UPI0010F5A931|nr:hypothetical protein [Marimonas lutisalis]